MSTNEEKKLDDFTRKILGEADLDKPSPMFLKNVMSQISVMSNPRLVFKPLIGKWLWYVIGAAATLLITWFFNVKDQPSLFDKWDFDFIPSLQLLHLPESISKIIIAAFVMIIVEIYLIKSWHQKKMDRL